MLSGAAWISVLATITVLIGSALWAERRYSGYTKLPARFDWRLRAASFMPRSIVLWMTPVVFVGILALIAWIGGNAPPERMHGDPNTGVFSACASVIWAQLFVLWLVGRWARGAA